MLHKLELLPDYRAFGLAKVICACSGFNSLDVENPK